MNEFRDTIVGKIILGMLITVAVCAIILFIWFVFKEFGFYVFLGIPAAFIFYKIGNWVNRN